MPSLASNISLSSNPRQRSPWLTFLGALLGLAFAHALVVLILGIDKPLLDLHAFRQTQTALSAYWLLHGGPWLAYETPVVGYPWSIPFEFPLYQLLVAGIAWIGVPLDVAGRLVGFSFFLAMLWPLRVLYAATGLSRAGYLATATLYLTSPLYLYWSRTFLMESCALFFSLAWLALTARYFEGPSRYTALAALACGCLAVLTKSTTFPAFAVVGGLLILYRLWESWRSADAPVRTLRMAAAMTISLLFPFAIGILWVWYSDHIKNANAFGQTLTSEALTAWNFGTLQQKLSAVLWVDTVRNRVLPDTLGRFVFIALIVLGATLTSRRTLAAMLIAMVGFAVPFLVFTNLHIVHNYYQNSNAIFLLAAIGLGVGRIFDSSQRAVAVLLLVVVSAGGLSYFYSRFAPFLTQDYSQNLLLRISQLAHDHTTDNNSLIIIGDDWSSSIPYLSQRKSLTLPAWTPKPLMERVFNDPQSFLGDRPLGAIVYCSNNLKTYTDRAPLVSAFVAGRQQLAEFGGCQLLSATR
jgi:hypothetical protein